MTSKARLEWNGEDIQARVFDAVQKGVDDTTRAAEEVAATTHWWKNRTGYLESQIETEPAVVVGRTISGKIGYTYGHGVKGIRSGFYGLFLEYRFPTLRPAGDSVFPTLVQRIKERLK